MLYMCHCANTLFFTFEYVLKLLYWYFYIVCFKINDIYITYSITLFFWHSLWTEVLQPLTFYCFQCYQWCGGVEPRQEQSEDEKWVGGQPRARWQALPRLPLPAAGRTGPGPIRPLPHHQRYVAKSWSWVFKRLTPEMPPVLILTLSYSTQFPHCHAISNNEPLHQRSAGICILKHKVLKTFTCPVFFQKFFFYM